MGKESHGLEQHMVLVSAARSVLGGSPWPCPGACGLAADVLFPSCGVCTDASIRPRRAKSFQHAEFGSSLAGTLCRAPPDMHVEYVSEVREIASRHNGMAGVAKGRYRRARELLVASSEVLEGNVLYVTGVP